MTDKVVAQVASTNVQDWSYVAEGNAAVVFSYCGPPHPIFTHVVLRLRKAAHQSGSYHLSIEDQSEDPMIVFQRCVISRLLPSKYLVRLQEASLEPNWLYAFATYHDRTRPPERRSVSIIDPVNRKAVLAEDLVGCVPCAVEIKPKWGFLPSSTHLSSPTGAIKSQTCRSCMHSYLRRVQGVVLETDDYCPLDLFSGNYARTTRAIKALWRRWLESNGSTNVLRIFADGKLIKPDDHKAVESWATAVLSSVPGSSFEIVGETFSAKLGKIILETPVLEELAKLQRELDPLDCEGLFELYKEAHDMPPMIEPTPQEWTAFIDEFLSDGRSRNHTRRSPEDLRYYTLAYVLSATFKDCSFVVSLCDPPNVKLVDLDPKSIRKLKYWKELDKEIVETYAQLEPSLRRHCVDGLLPQTQLLT